MSVAFSQGRAVISDNKYLPVVVVEDHNDVLYHIYRAIGAKRLPFHKGTILHFDSHPDMMIPTNFDTSRIYDKEYVISSLSIENWILPAVYAGHFSFMCWLKPPWATQIAEGVHSFKIGSHHSTGEIKVTCPESYFVSELAWCPEGELQSPTDAHLEVRTVHGEKQGDFSEFLSNDLTVALKANPYVLDIDLDFYSTQNPFLSLFTDEQFELLRQLYHYSHPSELTEEALQDATQRRKMQLESLSSAIQSSSSSSCMEDGGSWFQGDDGQRRWKMLQKLMSSFPNGHPKDPQLLNDAGCTCDDCDLPHHVSSQEQVRHLVDATRTFLKSLPTKPALVTIARSSRDDYCPPADVDFIQKEVLAMLTDVFGSLDVRLDYEAEDLNHASENSPSTS